MQMIDTKSIEVGNCLGLDLGCAGELSVVSSPTTWSYFIVPLENLVIDKKFYKNKN
jgi:hypothetical protein